MLVCYAIICITSQLILFLSLLHFHLFLGGENHNAFIVKDVRKKKQCYNTLRTHECSVFKRQMMHTLCFVCYYCNVINLRGKQMDMQQVMQVNAQTHDLWRIPVLLKLAVIVLKVKSLRVRCICSRLTINYKQRYIAMW